MTEPGTERAVPRKVDAPRGRLLGVACSLPIWALVALAAARWC